MKQKYVIILISLIFPLLLYSQENKEFFIRITIKNLPNKLIYIAPIYGMPTDEGMDTLYTNSIGYVETDITSYKTGMYRIWIEKDKYIDFIYNKENIEIQTYYPDIGDSLQFLHSEENKIYMQVIKEEKKFQSKIDMLTYLLNNYPDNNYFFNTLKKEYKAVQKERDNYLINTTKKYSNLYVSKLINLSRTPLLDPEMTQLQRLNYIKQHFWDNIDISDTTLFYSNGYANKFIAYLSLYNKPGMLQEEMENMLINAIDTALLYFASNKKMYDYMLKYMEKLFEKYELKKPLLYVYELRASSKTCSDIDELTAKKRSLAFSLMKKGSIVPDFEITDIHNKKYKLSESKYPYTLLIFFSTICNHCMNTIPKIQELYNLQSDKHFDIVAVSLDTSYLELSNFLNTNNYNDWIIYYEGKQWFTSLAELYNIAFTPVILLINRNLILESKPEDYDLLIEELRILGLINNH